MSQIRQVSARVFERMLKDAGLDAFNGPQGRILYVLWESGTLTISEIARRTSLAKTTLTSMLDRMEASGLVRRTPDPNNRRQTHVTITERAREYRQAYDGVSEAMSECYYEGFSEAEVRHFENMLQKVLTNLKKREEQ